MSNVTYKHQPAIDKTKGSVPLAGNTHLYTVSKLLWPKDVEDYLQAELKGITLHACCGKSNIGDIRFDLFEKDIDIRGDANRFPFATQSVNTVLIDPPYNGKFQWNHDMLEELARVAKDRIIFQHWFIPADKYGRYRKNHRFELSKLLTWMPKSYFGRVQMISIFDRVK